MKGQRIFYFLMAWLMVATFGYALALPFPQQDKQENKQEVRQNDEQDKKLPKHQPIQVDEDTIPDSLLHPRWKIQLTQPYSLSDLYQSPLDLKRPDALRYQAIYNDTLNRYVIGNRMGNTWLSAPIMLTPDEYMKWTEQNERNAFYRQKNNEIYQAKGKEKFDFSDMHFDLGPAEKIFGPGGIRVKTQGTAELKFGINKKNIDNPSLPIYEKWANCSWKS